MTKHEYMLRTNIESVEQAEELLGRVKLSFGGMFVAIIAIQFVSLLDDANIIAVLRLAYIVLFIAFLWFCHTVITAEKIGKASTVMCFIFAPISWLWQYPAITEPLLIITGRKESPASLPEQKELEEGIERRKQGWKKFWIRLAIAIAVFGAILFGALFYIGYLASKGALN